MSNVTQLRDVRNSRASTRHPIDQSAMLAVNLDELHLRLEELCEGLAGQLNAVESLLVDLADAVDADAFKTLSVIRQSLHDVDGLRAREQRVFQTLRRPDGDEGRTAVELETR